MSQLLDNLLQPSPSRAAFAAETPETDANRSRPDIAAPLHPAITPPPLPRLGLWLFGIAAAVASISPAAVLAWQGSRDNVATKPVLMPAPATPPASDPLSAPNLAPASASEPSEQNPTVPVATLPAPALAEPPTMPPATPSEELLAAYDAFLKGDDVTAAAAYQRRLKTAPSDRDARLGLAALALRQDRLDAARALYKALLAESPDDPVALAALATLDEPVDSGRLDRLAAGQQGAEAALALGNLRAAADDWAAAREAYARAVALAPDHADALFNLAVSHERLGLQDAPRRYRQALAAARQSVAGFDQAALRRHLESLERRRDAEREAADLAAMDGTFWQSEGEGDEHPHR